MGPAARQIGALVVALTAGTACCPSLANDAPITPPALRDKMFLFGGVDVARDSSSAWIGAVVAPVALLQHDGPRLRIMGGYGRYSYDASVVPGGVNDGETTSGEFMLGWRQDFSRAIVTAYIGAHVEHHSLAKPDPGNRATGTEAGVKALIEIFTRPAEQWIATASASISSVYVSYSARALIARELNGRFTLGVESAILGNERYREYRGGMAMNISLGAQILALAAGALDNSDKGSGYYLTTSLYAPF